MSAEQKPQVDELFGDDDAGMDAPPPGTDAQDGGGKKRGAKFKLVVLLLVLVGFAAFWFVSSAHHEQFYLTVDGRTVKVERGYFFPVGAGAWSSSNPAYTSFVLPEGVTPEKTGAMSLEEIDATLYTLYVDIARQNLTDFEMGDANVAEEMLRRANKLSSSSVAADRKLQEMRGDVAFRRGLKEVRDIKTRFDQALEQFESAHRQGGLVFQNADAWSKTIRRHRADYETLIGLDDNLDVDKVFGNPPKPPLEADAAPAEADAPAVEDEGGAETPAEAEEAPAAPANP